MFTYVHRQECPNQGDNFDIHTYKHSCNLSDKKGIPKCLKSFRTEVLMRLHYLVACPTRFLIGIYRCDKDLLSAFRNFWCFNIGSAFTINTRNYSKKSDLTNICYKILIRNSSNQKSITNKMLNRLPFFTSGEIVHGFGRGSRELGIPTGK